MNNLSQRLVTGIFIFGFFLALMFVPMHVGLVFLYAAMALLLLEIIILVLPHWAKWQHILLCVAWLSALYIIWYLGGDFLPFLVFFPIMVIWLCIYIYYHDTIIQHNAAQLLRESAWLRPVIVFNLLLILLGCGYAVLWLYSFYPTLCLLLLLLVWAYDIGAYIGGSMFGKIRIVPVISPNKSLEGCIAGALFCLLIVMLDYGIFGYFYRHFSSMLIFGMFAIWVAIMAQLGDLAQSALKRFLNVKDSGWMLPGHGGIFDRLDSILFVMLCVFCVIYFGRVA